MTLEIVWEFLKSFCVLFFITFVFSRLSIVKNHLGKKPVQLREKLLLALLFGFLGCVGSGIGIEFHDSLINTRVIGVAVGGLIGGPLVGMLSGTIAALHRIFCVSSGSATAVVCGVSMVLEGTFAGLLSRYSYKFDKLWVLATFTVVFCELFRKVMLLIFIRPFDFALLLVENMTMPMIVINSLGVALFVIFIENVSREREHVKARQSEVVLSMAEHISTAFKQGLIGENLGHIVTAIEENTDFSRILIASTASPIVSNLQEEDLRNIPIRAIADRLKSQTCGFSLCRDALYDVVAPLIDDERIAGFLLLGRGKPLSEYDCRLAEGLGKLFSSQLTIGNLEYRSTLLKEAEIKLLQTQISPHFLFNALTVIASLCRTDPARARSVIEHLAEFYRKNLHVNDQLVSLQDEVRHIEAYLEIIKARYASKIRVQYDIDETVACYLPPLSLQPLVENSIKHGLLPKRGGGVISIRAKWQELENAVRIEVEDNGKGFDPAKPKADDSNHVGLDNVKKRLRNCFGDDMKWEIDTEPDRGTRVTLVLPAVSNA